MDLGDINNIAGLLAVIGLPLFLHLFSVKARMRRDMRQAPLVDIAEVKPGMGTVRLVGRTKPLGEPTRSPFSNREGVLFEASASARESNGPIPLVRELDPAAFLLEDLTGSVLVRVSQTTKVLLSKELEWAGGSPQLKAFLTRHGRAEESGFGFGKKPLLFFESVLASDERTAVVGAVRWEHDPDAKEVGAGYRGGPRRLVVEAVMVATDET